LLKRVLMTFEKEPASATSQPTKKKLL
jgi:hypothetical protein